MLAILNFGVGFQSAPMPLPTELYNKTELRYNVFNRQVTSTKADLQHAVPDYFELVFSWNGQKDNATGARVYKLVDVIKS